MFYALSWFVIFSLLALWSLGAWAVHAAAVWTVSNAGALTGAALGAEGLRLPEWLAPWVPPEIAQSLASLLSGLAPVIEGLIQAMPALAGGLTPPRRGPAPTLSTPAACPAPPPGVRHRK